MPAKKKTPQKTKAKPKPARSQGRPDDVALSTLLGRQAVMGQQIEGMASAHPNDPALSAVLGKLAQIEERLDKMMERLDKGGLPTRPALRLPLAAPGASPLAVAPDADLPQFLARIPLFAKLSAIECAQLAPYFEPKSLAAAGVLFEQGAFGDAMYLLRTGSLEIYKIDNGQAVTVAKLQPGALVGEMALVENKPRSANVRASADAGLLALTRGAYTRLKAEQPQVATKFQDELLLLLSVRLRQTTERLAGKG